MAWIRTVRPEEARGVLKSVYDAAVRRAGKVFQILRIQSLHPRALRASTLLYTEVMHAADGALRRDQREMIAVAVSWANDCFY